MLIDQLLKRTFSLLAHVEESIYGHYAWTSLAFHGYPQHWQAYVYKCVHVLYTVNVVMHVYSLTIHEFSSIIYIQVDIAMRECTASRTYPERLFSN